MTACKALELLFTWLLLSRIIGIDCGGKCTLFCKANLLMIQLRFMARLKQSQVLSTYCKPKGTKVLVRLRYVSRSEGTARAKLASASLRGDGRSFCVLTHAHIDHVGYLPRLVKYGFSRAIYCTPATAELTELTLYDAANCQEEDANMRMKKASRNTNRLYRCLIRMM